MSYPNYPEMVYCSPEEYDAGKGLIVAPSSLCRDGLYSFIGLLRRPELPQFPGLIVPARINEADPAGRQDGPYVVAFTVETDSTADKPPQKQRVIVEAEGMIFTPMTGYTEGYFAHRPDDVDKELHDMVARTQVPIPARRIRRDKMPLVL